MENKLRKGFSLGIARAKTFLEDYKHNERHLMKQYSDMGHKMCQITDTFYDMIKDFVPATHIAEGTTLKNIYGNVGLLYAHSLLWSIINAEYQKVVQEYQEHNSSLNFENLHFLKTMKAKSRTIIRDMMKETKDSGVYFNMVILFGRYDRNFTHDFKDSLVRRNKYEEFREMQDILQTFSKKKENTMNAKKNTRKLAVEIEPKRPLAAQVKAKEEEAFEGHVMCDEDGLRFFCPGMNRNNSTAHIRNYKTLLIRLNNKHDKSSIPKAYTYDIEKWLGKLNFKSAVLLDGILNIRFYGDIFTITL